MIKVKPLKIILHSYSCLNFRWVYSHTNETLHELLEKELSEVAGKPLGFKDCYGGE